MVVVIVGVDVVAVVIVGVDFVAVVTVVFVQKSQVKKF